MASLPPLILLGGATKPAGADCLAQAHRRGIDVWLVDTAVNLAKAPDLAAQAARVVELPYAEVDSAVEWAVKAAAGQDFLGVYGTRETAAESVAAVAEALGLRGNPRAAVRRIQDKHACRRALAELGFPQPAAARCASARESAEFMAAHGPGPWIVKPTSGRGSAGVSLVHGAEDLQAALDHLAEARAMLTADLTTQGIAAPSGDEDDAGLLIEEFQTGTEYSAEGVFVDGLPRLMAVTAKLSTGAPHFVELGHAMPAPLDADAQAGVAAVLEKALPALGLGWGVFHVEFWLTGGGHLVLGEVHVRPGGDQIHVMAQHITGAEMHGAVFDQLLGTPVDTSEWTPRCGAAVRFLCPPPGVVTAVGGWDRVASDPGFLGGKLTLAPGVRVEPLRSSFDRSSFVCAMGETADAATRTAERLVRAVSVEMTAEE